MPPRRIHRDKKLPPSQWNRRAFLGREGLGSYGAGLVGALLGDAVPSPLSSPRAHGHVRVSRRAMACDFTLIFPAEYPSVVDAGCAALDEIERLESRLSAYLQDSDVSYLNGNACESAVTVDAELFALLESARRLGHETNGAFDIAAGTLVKAWGFFRGPKRVPAEAERQAALESSGMAHVELDADARSVRFARRGLEINVGAIGKGYAIDRALELIGQRFNAHNALMHGGQSSVKGIGTPPEEPRGWKVEIGDPHRPGKAVAAVWLRNRALGTSSAANQWFVEGGRRYGHVLDPRTGWPAEGIASASVVAPSAAEADALSTAFFVAGVEPARRYCEQHPEIGVVLVTEPEPGREREVIAIGASGEVRCGGALQPGSPW